MAQEPARIPPILSFEDFERQALGMMSSPPAAIESESAPQPDQAAAAAIGATPFSWLDCHNIPEREWIYGRTLIRRYVTVTVAPGGVGKSSLTIVEALAMVSGRPLLHDAPAKQLRVWLWNGEDPKDELQRRIMAAARLHGISRDEIGGLFVDSGLDCPIVLAKQTGSATTIVEPVQEKLVAELRGKRIDVIVIDPFVSSHEVPENDNPAMDRVAKAWARVAARTGAAVHLIHHVRKTGGNEISIDDARGGGALINAARVGRVLNPMSTAEAERAGVEHRFRYVRIDDGKANLAPRAEKSAWVKIESVPLMNGSQGGTGDSVGVVTAWEFPNPMDAVTVDHLRRAQAAVNAGGPYRENSQAADWVGLPIGRAMGLEVSPDGKLSKADAAKVKAALAVWISNGMFEVYEAPDAKREKRKFVKVGEPADD
ncbi:MULTISPECIES: AAA family ATPase [Hyphomicrobiales]|uniref:AAA family ATPase n=1 Tax=Methylobacterium sp. CCH7-A2 TaxID=1768789 RepID=UPI001FD9BE2E|nr:MULTISPECIES: AAA family ATPase [Hyphomicrobiales]